MRNLFNKTSKIKNPVQSFTSSKIKNVLITQPAPLEDHSPYFDLQNKFDIKLDFKPFISIEGVSLKEFRSQKINPLDFTAVIFTSRNAVDNFFRICQEMRIEMPPETKYFCVSEQTSNYLQKYIVIRKRKVFAGLKTATDLIEILKKHKKENFLFPCSDIRKQEIPDFMEANNFNFKEAILYRTVASDLTAIPIHRYDIIAFYSPSGVHALFKNYPKFKQNHTRIAAFGPTTAKAVKDSGMTLEIEAPSSNAPSMASALDIFIKKVNK